MIYIPLLILLFLIIRFLIKKVSDYQNYTTVKRIVITVSVFIISTFITLVTAYFINFHVIEYDYKLMNSDETSRLRPLIADDPMYDNRYDHTIYLGYGKCGFSNCYYYSLRHESYTVIGMNEKYVKIKYHQPDDPGIANIQYYEEFEFKDKTLMHKLFYIPFFPKQKKAYIYVLEDQIDQEFIKIKHK